MQSLRYTKSLLYKEIEKIRQYIDIRDTDYPLNMVAIAESGGLSVDTHDFKTRGLKGILAIDGNEGHIILDAKESRFEQNFFCGHESIHFLLHRDVGQTSFQCYDQVKPKQNRFLEWHANEGAAELLVPYHLFIPRLLQMYNPVLGCGDYEVAVDTLSSEYGVSDMVIRNRIENLKYEIYQVAKGTPISDILILSKTQQERQGITIPSCRDIWYAKCFSEMA